MFLTIIVGVYQFSFQALGHKIAPFGFILVEGVCLKKLCELFLGRTHTIRLCAATIFEFLSSLHLINRHCGHFYGSNL